MIRADQSGNNGIGELCNPVQRNLRAVVGPGKPDAAQRPGRRKVDRTVLSAAIINEKGVNAIQPKIQLLVDVVDTSNFQYGILLPGFHVAKSVKLRNLDNISTLRVKTGISNQHFMKLEPK